MNNLSEKLREFLEKKPLYSWQKFELPEYSTQFTNLFQIEMECPTCKRSRPFSDRQVTRSAFEYSIPKLESRIYPFCFKCDSCSSTEYAFFVEVDIENGKIRKVGQSPAWSITLDKDIDRFLEDDSEYFKKALICESQGYGIAAFSYYRRTLENSIGKILDNLRSILEMQGSSSENIEQIDRALKGIVMDEIIKIAKDAIPNSLRPNGMNPLAIIYDTLSAGIHRLPEEECLKNSEYIRVALSYLIKTLSRQNEEQRAFLDATKSLNDFNSKSS
ncbi:hypothetical protein H6F50_14335 [Coleofasciculus sp. FACHB-712]|uniref:hypothetical protein n=1 Tax=Coleofasciculus sp. FACHB-712 TaxID=2692789 RepID=UPI001686A91B|nr:hypothetical protein [Coleofasciculus sp. FACHB-712]MBD1943519.1 hypothetical protein [Coleofasciculus sp. FACHB-712]